MTDIGELRKADAELTEEQKLDNALRLAFGGDRDRFVEFRDVLTVSIPENTAAVLGGSSVTGHNYHTGAPFDADGPMTSDLDITLVGSEVIGLFSLEGFWVPGVHSHPVKDGDEEIAPALKPLRRKLQEIVGGRPVTIQATRDFYIWVREHWLGQPYLTLVGKVDET
ncbi:MAG TPA: hypothetical protein VNA22_07170 [Pyrinomonadaceae bacterium]|nr:hypothetical protein [Pyrinomonadaceae bacterium]